MTLQQFKHLVRIIPAKYNQLDITLVDVNFKHHDVVAFVHRERDTDYLCLKGVYNDPVKEVKRANGKKIRPNRNNPV